MLKLSALLTLSIVLIAGRAFAADDNPVPKPDMEPGSHAQMSPTMPDSSPEVRSAMEPGLHAQMSPTMPDPSPEVRSAMEPGSQMKMNPYFSAKCYNLPKDSLMLMALPDFQIARTGPNFFTGMIMAEYGVTDRLTVGVMAEGQKIHGLPATYGGVRFNAYYRVVPEDHFLNFTLYGEYEGLNKAALYKMEVAGFGGEDLEGSLREARRTPVRTFEQRAIMYHDWGRLNVTFNFVSETALNSHLFTKDLENDFGYTFGVFRQPSWMGMGTGMDADKTMPGMAMDADKTMPGMAHAEKQSTPPVLSFQRLGYGVEMIGALGNTHKFGSDWNHQQHYVGPVFSYALSQNWSFRVESAVGLSPVSDPFVLRVGVSYSIEHVLNRLGLRK